MHAILYILFNTFLLRFSYISQKIYIFSPMVSRELTAFREMGEKKLTRKI